MRNAFDNYESVASVPPALAMPFASDLHFLGHMFDRITDRVLHSSGEREARRVFAEFLLGQGQTDRERMHEILDFIDASSRPFFAHLHFMGTHPPYRPRESTFAGGETEAEQETDEYDSAIRSFDEYTEAIFTHLRETGRLSDTLIVITSDHSRGWEFSRVPMLFFFPGGEHRGVIRANAQLLDLAPTILDYMGLSPPPWMEGQSLLRGEPDPLRPIWTVVTVLGAGPPYPRMGRIGITVCDRTTWLKPRVAKIAVEPVPGHSAPCSDASLPPLRRQRREIVDELARGGYDVSHLRRGRGAGRGGGVSD